MLEIKCQERNSAKIFYLLSVILAIISGYILYLAFQPGSISGVWFGLVAFISFSGLFYILGHYHRTKYARLGHTPLFITEPAAQVGGAFRGRIRICKPHFSKVKHVTLTNIMYKGADSYNRYTTLHSSDGDCHPQHEAGYTWLDFEVEVPEEGRATQKLHNRSYFWELSMEYTEHLSLVKRSWLVEINPALE